MHFGVTGEMEWRTIQQSYRTENISDCYDHWMLWAQIAHADVTNIQVKELKEHQTA